jgi:hypothetical protein
MIKSQLIKDTLDLLLDSNKDAKLARAQINYLVDANYNYSDIGVFIKFSHSPEATLYRVAESDLMLNGVAIESPDLKAEADATLFFADGVIDYLEIWTRDGEYPEKDLKTYKVTQEWEGSPGRQIVASQ